MAIKLTKAETDVIDWAVEAMADLSYSAGYTVADGWYEPEDLPVLRGRSLDLSKATENAIEDLLYRVEAQMPDMAEGELGIPGANSRIAMCGRLGDKIRAEAGID